MLALACKYLKLESEKCRHREPIKMNNFTLEEAQVPSHQILQLMTRNANLAAPQP